MQLSTIPWWASMVLIPSVAAAQLELPAAEFTYPIEDGTIVDLNEPGMGSIAYPCTGRPNCPLWGETATGFVDGFALGDGAPEVRARFNLTDGPSPLTRSSIVRLYFRVVGTGTDPFGALELVPLRMDYFVNLFARPQGAARVTASAIVTLRNMPQAFSVVLLERHACSSPVVSGTESCFGSIPENCCVFDQGTQQFFAFGDDIYWLHMLVSAQRRCFAGGACSALASAYLDPLPVLDLELDPAQYGRPPGFRLQDHYRIEYSANHILGPRRPGEMFRDGFDASAAP